MKRSLLALVVTALALGSLTSAKAAVETYNIDPVHTWVGFSVAHFFTKVPGYFGKVKGTIVVDRDHLENSTVEAVIQSGQHHYKHENARRRFAFDQFLCRRPVSVL